MCPWYRFSVTLASPIFGRAFALTRRTWSEIVTLIKLTKRGKGAAARGANVHTRGSLSQDSDTQAQEKMKKEPGAAGPVEHL